MPKVTVSDTSCLILFYKIGKIDLLKELFGKIYITETVSKEFRQSLPEWVEVKNPTSGLEKGLSGYLDPGEATSIALAAEENDSLLIIDEIKGRKAATEMEVTLTGSLGILVAAKRKRYIQAVKPLIEKMQKTNFRISKERVDRVLQTVDEA